MSDKIPKRPWHVGTLGGLYDATNRPIVDRDSLDYIAACVNALDAAGIAPEDLPGVLRRARRIAWLFLKRHYDGEKDMFRAWNDLQFGLRHCSEWAILRMDTVNMVGGWMGADRVFIPLAEWKKMFEAWEKEQAP